MLNDLTTLKKQMHDEFPLEHTFKHDSFFLRYGQSGFPDEFDEDILNRIYGKGWVDISTEDWAWLPGIRIVRGRISLNDYLYLLPSFLMLSLEGRDGMSWDGIFDALDISSDQKKRVGKGFWEVVNNLSSRQVLIVRHVLEYMAKNDDDYNAYRFVAESVLEQMDG